MSREPVSDRLLGADAGREDVPETSLRPQTLDEFIGQAQTRANLKIFIQAAKTRAEAGLTLTKVSSTAASAGL